MASNSLKVNTEQVGEIANQLESLNQQLTAELQSCKQTIDNLENIWSGEAASATISAFNEFSAKYFQKYEDVITQYITFLRNNVDAGYFEVESANTNLSDAFK